MQEIAYELNYEGARLVRAAAITAENDDGRKRFVAGALGPTNRTASISPDVANPGFRAITFDQLRKAYGEQVRGLLTGGADLLLIETIFDTLNAKAAIYAIAEQCAERGVDVPIMSPLAAGQGWSRSTPMRGDDGVLPSTRRSRSLIAAAAKATSATEAANSPAVSRCHDTHFMPMLGNSRYDGLKPATPQ